MIKKTTLVSLLAMAAMVKAQADGFGDAADDFADAGSDAIDGVTDAADDAAEEGEAIADDAFGDAEAIAADAEGDAAKAAKDGVKAAKATSADAPTPGSNDWRLWKDPELWIGIIDCIDVLWWLVWGWFVYIRTNDSDWTMTEYSGTTANTLLPIAWFWSNLSSTTRGYTALAYLFIWLFYLIIAVPGMIFFIMHMVEADADRCNDISGTWLFQMWSRWPGLYGSWILYFFTVIMPILDLALISRGDIFAPGWINSVVQVSMMTLTWLATGIIHVLFSPALVHQYETRCNGQAPLDLPAPAPKPEIPEVTPEEPEPIDDGNDWD